MCGKKHGGWKNSWPLCTAKIRTVLLSLQRASVTACGRFVLFCPRHHRQISYWRAQEGPALSSKHSASWVILAWRHESRITAWPHARFKCQSQLSPTLPCTFSLRFLAFPLSYLSSSTRLQHVRGIPPDNLQASLLEFFFNGNVFKPHENRTQRIRKLKRPVFNECS